MRSEGFLKNSGGSGEDRLLEIIYNLLEPKLSIERPGKTVMAVGR